MRCPRPAPTLFSLLSLLLLCSGCYGPYYSPYGGYGNPYGPGAYPAPGGPPTQTLQPGGTYTPMPGQPVPGSTIPQGSLGQPSAIDQTSGDAFYGSDSSSTQPYDNGGGVPTYDDPNETGEFQPPVQPDNTAVEFNRPVYDEPAQMSAVPAEPIRTAGFAAPPVTDPASAPSEPTPAAVTELPASAPQLTGDQPQFAEQPQTFAQPAEPTAAQTFSQSQSPEPAPQFEPPQQIEVAEGEATPLQFAAETTDATSSTVATSPVTTSPATLPAAPYAHDADYSWLRGVLRFDASAGVWTMTYSDKPAPKDEHGGKLLVGDSPLLEQFKPQAVVLLRGGIDPQQSRAAGRAVFRADVIEPVEPSVP